MVSPASRQISTSRVASATSVAPHALKNSLPPPKVPVPRVSAGTMNPEPPSRLYSIRISSLLLSRQSRRPHAAAHRCFQRRRIFGISVITREDHAVAFHIRPLQSRRAGDGRAFFRDDLVPRRFFMDQPCLEQLPVTVVCDFVMRHLLVITLRTDYAREPAFL